jgi:ribonucleoside-triphosphate reductase
MTQTEINAKIAELEGELAHPGQYPTEIYTRIVGYYRSLANWNAGKREEYNHRQTFAEDAGRIRAALEKAEAKFANIAADAAVPCAPETKGEGKAASYLVFVQDKCPNCPAMKAKLPTLGFSGQAFDVAGDAGFTAASTWNVTATPTLVLLDGEGRELDRIMSAADWKQIEAYL